MWDKPTGNADYVVWDRDFSARWSSQNRLHIYSAMAVEQPTAWT